MNFTPIQSNKFHYTNDPEKNVVLGFTCEIHTRTLTIPYLNPKSVRRLELLSELHDQGVTDRQISEWFNSIELLTPQGKRYSKENVWVTRKKWTQRKVRENDTYFIVYPPQFMKIHRTKK